MTFLDSATQPFSVSRFEQLRTTNRLGRHIHYFASLDSTNTFAKDAAFRTLSDGDLIITDYQTAGRGRRSRYWFSSFAQGLTFSIILRDHLATNRIGLYPLIAGISLARLLKDLHFEGIGLKWPNDVLLDDKKVSGILCESRLRGAQVRQLIMGIGINVNETKDDLPLDLIHSATSLAIVARHSFQREAVLAGVLRHLEGLIDELEHENTSSLRQEWMDLCHHKDQEVQVYYQGQYRRGLFMGLTPEGNARISFAGEEKMITSEEII